MTVSYNNQFTTLGTPLNRVIHVDYVTPTIAIKHYCTIQRTASDIANNRADDGGWFLSHRTAVGLRGQRRILLTTEDDSGWFMSDRTAVGLSRQSDIANNREDDSGWFLSDRTAVGLRGQRRILLTEERTIADGF
jgi:hypothetical protein